MFKRWIELILDHKVSLKERMFRIVTGVCMIALAIILPMGRSLINVLTVSYTHLTLPTIYSV